MGFYAQALIEEKDLKVVGCTFMLVGPNVDSVGDNLKLGAQAVAHKVMGQ